MIERLDRLDQQLMVWMNYDGTPWTDAFWYTYSQKWTWAGAAIAILLVIVLRYRHHWRHLLVAVLALALVVALSDQVSSGLIKHLVCRPRPSHQPLIEHLLYYVGDYRGGRYGFVSSHAANSIGMITLLFALFRGVLFRSTLLLWALANCYSRIYLGVHYPGDILGGVVVGLLMGWAVVWTLRRLEHSRWLRRHDTALTRHEEAGYAHEPWPVTLTVWLTVLFLAVAAL